MKKVYKIIVTIFIILYFFNMKNHVNAAVLNDECEKYGRQFLENCVGYDMSKEQYQEHQLFYNEDNEVSAIYIKYTASYVILSNVNDTTEVLEYAYNQSDSFMDIVKKELDSKNIKNPIYYCIDNSRYYIVDGDNFETYIIQNGTIKKCNEELDIDSLCSGSSSYKGGNFYLSNPDTYERGYYSKSVKNISSYNITYKTTSDFSGYVNHCAPTAAINLMKYWYNRNNKKYDALLYKNSWTKTFKKLYDYFGTTSSGTLDDNLVKGYKKFFDLVSINYSSITMTKNVSFTQMKEELDANFPFHIIVHKHSKYKDHSMLAVGYVSYVHVGSITEYSNYIRVVDGFSTSPNRYINASVGQDKIHMVSIRLK